MDDASYKDVQGNASMLAKEAVSLSTHLSNVGKEFRNIKKNDLRNILEKSIKCLQIKVPLSPHIKHMQMLRSEQVSSIHLMKIILNMSTNTLKQKIIAKVKIKKNKTN